MHLILKKDGIYRLSFDKNTSKDIEYPTMFVVQGNVQLFLGFKEYFYKSMI